MRSLLLLPLLLAAVGSAQAQHGARVVDVQLSSFDFTPSEIHLRADQPVVLRLTNTSSGGHNFAAPQFFGAARVEGGAPRNGAIEVPEGETREVRLTPVRGTYRLRCTHTLHTAFGMTGSITVE